ncbi:MAG: tetratricopeptide repeat protein [Planctomycetes bacterium]|nr:tetratricopeptide repeat protein [Planctomycetota bacterium]
MRTSLQFAGVLAGLCLASTLHAQAGQPLFDKTHKGAKEPKVSKDWEDKLPIWANSLTSKNQFIQTWLMLDENFRPSDKPGKFEIRDANKEQFSAYAMVRDGVDANGLPVYKATSATKWISWKSWPARFVLTNYPVETNNDQNDLVAFGAWLFGQKENDLANRVLTLVHGKNKELAPLIEAYIAEKYGWKDAGALESFNLWDAEFQRERTILITAADKAARVSAREKAAKAGFDEIVRVRGAYKGKAPRKPSPTKQLILIEWEIKQFKIAYASSDFLKNTKNADVLQAILDSIVDDKAVIKSNREDAAKLPKNDKDAKGMKAKAERMEQVLVIDPMDVALRSETANAWYLYGAPLDHGNGCERTEGINAAIPHYKKILEVYPNNSAFLLALGRCYQALEDSKQARPYYQKVIDLEGDKGLGSTAQALMRNMDARDITRLKEEGKK